MAMHPSLYARASDHIKAHGRTVIGVFGDVDSPPFAYTIGNYQKGGMPELLLIGLYNEEARDMLNMASDLQNARGRVFADGELVSLGGQFPLKVLDVSNKQVRDNWTIQAGQYWGHENYPVRQLVMCDKKGRYPGDRGCASPYSKQPLLNKTVLQ